MQSTMQSTVKSHDSQQHSFREERAASAFCSDKSQVLTWPAAPRVPQPIVPALTVRKRHNAREGAFDSIVAPASPAFARDSQAGT
jgi:hypothetical protein